MINLLNRRLQCPRVIFRESLIDKCKHCVIYLKLLYICLQVITQHEDYSDQQQTCRRSNHRRNRHGFMFTNGGRPSFKTISNL